MLIQRVMSIIKSDLVEAHEANKVLQIEGKRVSSSQTKFFSDYNYSQQPDVHKLINQLAIDCTHLIEKRDREDFANGKF